MSQAPTHPGDSNRITRDYFDQLLIELRLVGSDLADTRLTLYGETFATPVMTAALSHLNQLHPEGMVELARGAAAANAVLWAGMGDDAEMEGMAATGARVVKIIKPYADNALILHKIRHAEENGALAVGMDIDHTFGHKGGYDNILGYPMQAKSLAELKDFIAATRLPFIIKGVLSERDADLCLEIGAKGIVVSHHHGIIRYAVPPLMALPAIARLVAGRIPIFVDCGIESGMDAFKALALGADAVSVGRALMEPLRAGGSGAVAQAITGMTTELAHAMAMTGSKDVKSIDPSVIRNA